MDHVFFAFYCRAKKIQIIEGLTRAKDSFSLVESLASINFGAHFISRCTARVTFMIFHENENFLNTTIHVRL